MPKLRMDIWSDLACPWCYVGKRRLEKALAQFDHASDVQIVWRSYELNPSSPRIIEGDFVVLLAEKYRTTKQKAQEMIQRLVDNAAQEGIAMRFDKLRAGNTFDGHRLLHLAGERGKQGALKERLVHAYFCEGEALGDPAALTRLAGEVGLDEKEVTEVLASDRYADGVRGDQALARELKVSGVPFFVLDTGETHYAVAGAQPVEEMLGALREAWTALVASQPVEVAAAQGGAKADEAAPVCGPDGCA